MNKLFSYISFFLIFSVSFVISGETPKTEADYLSDIIKAIDAFNSKPSEQARDKWIKTASEAFHKYPDSTEIATRYSYAEYLRAGTKTYLHLKVLAPHIRAGKSCAFYGLWMLLRLYYDNAFINRGAYPGGEKGYLKGHNWNQLLDESDMNIETLQLLRLYVAGKVDASKLDSFGANKRGLEKLRKDASEPLDEKQKKRAESILNSMLSKAVAYEEPDLNWKKWNNNSQTTKKTPDASSKQALVVHPKTVWETLSELEKKHRMDYVEIQSFFGHRLKAFMNELKDKPDLPNLEKIKEANSATEAVVLNLWYKFAIHGKNQEVYDVIGTTDGWEKESRLVMLRMICARDLKHPKEELVELCDALVKLEPKNQLYRHTRLSLDAPQTASGGNAMQQKPDPYLMELQRRRFASAEEVLKELETKRKWELLAIELLVNKASSFRKALKRSSDLPNLEKVKTVQTESEAAILNLWYKYGIHRSYQEIYDAIDKTPAWEKDSRLVFLRLLCGRRLNIGKTELLKLCEMLIALEPNNQRFKHLKLTFEMN